MFVIPAGCRLTARRASNVACTGVLWVVLLCALVAPDVVLGARALAPSPDFAVTLDGQPAFVYMGAVPGPTGRGRMNASFVHVILPAAASANVAAAVVVEVEVLAAANGTVPLGRAGLRPRGSPAVAPSSTRPASAVTFTVAEPGHFVLEVGGFFNVSTLSVGLMVFVSAADAAPPAPGDPSVTYFGAGVHALPGAGVLTLRSDSTVYLAPGAVVLGTIRGAGVHNVTVRGPGILAAEWLPGDPLPASASACPHCGCPGTDAIAISNSSRVTLDGFTLMHATSWMVRLQGLDTVRVRGLKELGWRCNNDGVDIVSSRDVVVERCFIRSADDAIAVKGLDATKDTRDVLVRDNVFFPHGNCMEIGFELYNTRVTNITFERNLCIHQMMNAFSIHNGGRAAVSDITYRDNIIEGVLGPLETDLSYGYKLVDLQISEGRYSGPDVGPALRGSISNVVYSNITYHSNGLDRVVSRMVGNSTLHAVDGVHVTSFTINGTAVESLHDLGTVNNSFVRHVTFSPHA